MSLGGDEFGSALSRRGTGSIFEPFYWSLQWMNRFLFIPSRLESAVANYYSDQTAGFLSSHRLSAVHSSTLLSWPGIVSKSTTPKFKSSFVIAHSLVFQVELLRSALLKVSSFTWRMNQNHLGLKCGQFQKRPSESCQSVQDFSSRRTRLQLSHPPVYTL